MNQRGSLAMINDSLNPPAGSGIVGSLDAELDCSQRGLISLQDKQPDY